MPRFRFFYDYECPFCKRGYEDLMELIPAYPGMEIEWRPIESHPRPERCSPHTDLCIQAFYIAEELGADIAAFHKKMFAAVAFERQNVEKTEVLAKILEDVVDGGKLQEILKSGKYAFKVGENNDLAYEKSDVWFVPAFRGDAEGSLKLDAKGGRGVSREGIKAFLDKCL